MAKSRKKHGANELSLALGISVAILVIGVVVFLLSPKVCTGGDECKGRAAKNCTEPCKMKHKLFSALMSDEKKQPILNIGGGGKKKTTGLCCDDSTGGLCSGYDQSKGRSGCSGANLPPGCSWRPGAQKCTPKPTPKPKPKPTPTPTPTPPTPSGQKCLCGAGKMDWQGKECGERGPAGGDDFCTTTFQNDKICGNVGTPDGCVMTSRKPHTSNDAPDVRSCTDELRMTNSQCMQGYLDQSSDQCKMAMRACGGSGPDPGPGEMGPGCYGRDSTGVLEYLGKSCSDAPECGRTFTCQQVEGFRARRRRRCM